MLIGKLIAEIVYPSAAFLKRHMFLAYVILVITLGVMAFGAYRVYQLRSLPCFPGVCQKPVLPY